MTSVVLGSVAPWRVANASARRRVGGRAVAVHSAGWAMKDENKGKMIRWCGGAHVECSGRGGGGGVGVGSGVGLAAVRRSRVVMRAAEGDDEEGGDVAAAAEKGEEKEEEEEEKKQRLADEELARLRQLPLADKGPDGGENVVGAEGVPQAIIEAERKSKPLRRWRLVTYALASSAAAAQMVTLIDTGIMQWPKWLDDAPIMLVTDILVIISGSMLWRTELANRADSLKMIWLKAQSREESLNRAEAGLGDTLWTSRMRKKTDQGK